MRPFRLYVHDLLMNVSRLNCSCNFSCKFYSNSLLLEVSNWLTMDILNRGFFILTQRKNCVRDHDKNCEQVLSNALMAISRTKR